MGFQTNTKVQRHSFGISGESEFSNMSSAFAAGEFFKNRAVLEHVESIDRSVEKKEKEGVYKDGVNKIVNAQILESQRLSRINDISRQGKEIVFKEIMFEMFSKSLLLDDEFVVEKEENLRGLIESYIDGNGGYAMLTEAYKRTKSPLLSRMMKICEAVTKQVSNRKMKELQSADDVSTINFSLDDEEKETLDYEKEKLSVDELSDLVKKKVFSVIQDEKSRQQKEEELEQDLMEETDEDRAVKESINRIVFDKSPVEVSTTFNSIFRHSLKQSVTESVASHVPEDEYDDEDQNDYVGVDADEDEIKENEFGGFIDIQDEINDHGAHSSDIDMDMVLAESITQYTLMELCYTIKLEDYTHESLRKISESLLN